MLEAKGLFRRYGDFDAVSDVSFTVDDGEILGMLGPNGAGKTTTIRMLTGFLPMTAGRVTIAGYDLSQDPLAAKRQIGYLPENISIYPEMRVEEYLFYRARLQGLTRAERRPAVEKTMERCLIADVRRQTVGTLSKGYRQRVGLAAAILHEPKVLILDEPTVGLDPRQIIAIRDLIRELGEERTLLVSTHILPEVELLCDRVLILDKGRVVDQGSPENLRERWRGNSRVTVVLKEQVAEAQEALAGLGGVLSVERDGRDRGRLHIECEADRDIREDVFRAVVERDWVLLEMREEKMSLEDIFVRLTTTETVVEEASEGEDAA